MPKITIILLSGYALYAHSFLQWNFYIFAAQPFLFCFKDSENLYNQPLPSLYL